MSNTPALSTTALFLLLFSLPLSLPASPRPAEAGDEAHPTEASKKPHLEYRETYQGALLEARIRNLPVFVSRHKDF